MNNDNFVATYPRTVVQCTMKCETTTKIYSVRKLHSLVYVHDIIFLFRTSSSMLTQFLNSSSLCPTGGGGKEMITF